jgi:hypothetical protein
MAKLCNAHQDWQNVKMISGIGKTFNDYKSHGKTFKCLPELAKCKNDYQDWQNVVALKQRMAGVADASVEVELPVLHLRLSPFIEK